MVTKPAVKTTFTLLGFVPSKKSLYRRRKGSGLYFNDAANRSIGGLLLQVRAFWKRRPPVDPAAIVLGFTCAHRKADLDGKQATILDCLQRAGVIRNDNMAHVLLIQAMYAGKGRDQTTVEIMAVPTRT